ncbi:MAG: diaminopimelate epimerase [Bacteroidales bacterium]|nr:diaminopimelate epimerase [Bacteroidales bacterium]
MMLNFYKYQGTGNDFIIIDNRTNPVSLSKEQINTLCDRKFGIGADGLMFLENHNELDFNMRYFNSDGNESTICGNGGRCLVAFAKSLNIIDKSTIFNSIDGKHKAKINSDDTISLEMQNIDKVNLVNMNYFLSTGSPHYVTFKENIKDIDVFNRGKEIRNSAEFSPEGTNVNFVEFVNDKIYVRTYERGVENETLSCGTGVTASAICASLHKKTDKSSYNIVTNGGNLNVSFQKHNNNTFTDIWLTGPAKFVFKGEIDI